MRLIRALLLALLVAAECAHAQVINLATNVRGNLSVNNLNGGANASNSTFWRGDGTWGNPAALGYVTGPASSTNNDVALFNGATGTVIKDGGPLTISLLANIGANTVLGNPTAGSAAISAMAIGGCSSASSALIWTTNTGFGCNTSITAGTNANLTGPVTSIGNATTITSTITAGGPTGSGTVAPIITYNAAGQLTAVSSATIAPAVGSVTGLGTGVATALGVNVGSAGAPVVNGGVLGTPSSGTATNLSGTAASLTAGTATNVAGGGAGSVPYQTGSGATSMLGAGAANLAMFMNSAGTAPSWAATAKVITSTINTANATASVSYTGVGFKPSSVIALALINSSTETSIGIADASTQRVLFNSGSITGSTWAYDTQLVYMDQSAGNVYGGTVTSFDSDGLTISWTKTGATVGTALLFFLCFR